MKKQLIIYCLILFLFQHCKKPGCFSDAGPMVSVKRQVSSFHRIDLYNNINLVLVQDTIESITVEAPKNIEPNISATIQNGILTLHNNTGCKWLRNPSENLKVYVGVKNLDYINYAGSGNITSANT